MPLFFPLRVIYPVDHVLIHDYRVLFKRRLLGHIFEFLKCKVVKRRPLKDFISLRRIMDARTPEPSTNRKRVCCHSVAAVSLVLFTQPS